MPDLIDAVVDAAVDVGAVDVGAVDVGAVDVGIHAAVAAAPRPFPMNFDFHRGGVRVTREAAFDPAFDRIVATRRFDAQQLVFAGHFPANKILPGVMLVEFALYLAQAYLRERGDQRKLIEVTSATFLAPVTPGYQVRCSCDMVPADHDTVSMRATLTRIGAAAASGSNGSAGVDGDVICAKVRAVFGRR